MLSGRHPQPFTEAAEGGIRLACPLKRVRHSEPFPAKVLLVQFARPFDTPDTKKSERHPCGAWMIYRTIFGPLAWPLGGGEHGGAVAV